MPVTATHVSYYHICHRKLWLFAQGITMEHTSETVATGRFIHETSYPQRSDKFTEISIGGSKIDFYDPANRIIHETKKSNRMEAAHEWQVKYYLYLLATEAGVEDARGVLEYPTLRQTKEVTLTAEDRQYLAAVIPDIERLVAADVCPPVIDKPVCKQCSYFEFCYSGE